MTHAGGGSHGALEAEDSLLPLLLVGCEPGLADTREQWRISDIAELVADHFGVAARREAENAQTAADPALRS